MMQLLRAFLVSVIILLGLFSSDEACAQKFEGKAVLGINGSQLDGDRMSGFNKGGPVAGLAASYPLDTAGKWFLQPEILFSQKGSQHEEIGYPRYQLNYIEVPIMFRYRIQGDLHTEFGVTTDLLLSARLNQGSGYFSRTDQYFNINWNLMGGFAYGFWGRMELNFRYGYSVRSSSPQEKLFHNYIMATLRYHLSG